MRNGDVLEAMRDELDEGRALFRERIDAQVRDERDYPRRRADAGGALAGDGVSGAVDPRERASILADLASTDEEVRRLAVERAGRAARRRGAADASPSASATRAGACARPPSSAWPARPKTGPSPTTLLGGARRRRESRPPQRRRRGAGADRAPHGRSAARRERQPRRRRAQARRRRARRHRQRTRARRDSPRCSTTPIRTCAAPPPTRSPRSAATTRCARSPTTALRERRGAAGALRRAARPRASRSAAHRGRSRRPRSRDPLLRPVAFGVLGRVDRSGRLRGAAEGPRRRLARDARGRDRRAAAHRVAQRARRGRRALVAAHPRRGAQRQGAASTDADPCGSPTPTSARASCSRSSSASSRRRRSVLPLLRAARDDEALAEVALGALESARRRSPRIAIDAHWDVARRRPARARLRRARAHDRPRGDGTRLVAALDEPDPVLRAVAAARALARRGDPRAVARAGAPPPDSPPTTREPDAEEERAALIDALVRIARVGARQRSAAAERDRPAGRRVRRRQPSRCDSRSRACSRSSAAPSTRR